MAAILEVEDLVKKYGDHVAVNGVSFALPEGEIFGLLGPNGAGKTTTFSMLATLVMPTSGKIRLGGFDVLHDPDKVKPLVGIVPQELALYPTLSARDNLLFFGQMYGLRGSALKSRIDDVLEIVGLQERAGDAISPIQVG